MNEQAKHWMENDDLQKFIRQAHMDMHVGLKNGVSERELNWAIHDLLNSLDNQLHPSRMVKVADGVFKEVKMNRSLS